MKFKSIASPEPSKGVKYSGKKLCVPNQALSLKEILARFVRGEPLPIGREGMAYHESEDDLEKMRHLDLVDRQEYIDKLKQTQKDFDHQEKAKAKKERQRLDALAVEKLAADKAAKEKGPPPPNPIG